MPIKCSVRSCGSLINRDQPFFKLPAALSSQSLANYKLTKLRRKLWLKAIDLEDSPSADNVQICGRHFLNGKPAKLINSTDIDWVPSFYVKNSPAQNVNNTKTVKKKEFVQCNLSVKELNKCVSCKVVLERNILGDSFKGTNGSSLPKYKRGLFTISDVSVQETAVDNKLLRIPLVRQNLDELKSSTQIIKPKRGRKRKSQPSSDAKTIKKKSVDMIPSPASKQNGSKDLDSPKKEATQKVGEVSLRKLKVKAETTLSGTPQKVYPQIAKQTSSLTDKIRYNIKTIIRRTSQDVPSNTDAIVSPSAKVKQVFTPALRAKSETPPAHKETVHVMQSEAIKQTEALGKTKYCLVFPIRRYHVDGTFNYPFERLVVDVKYMKLPTPNWKIKVIIRQGKIGAITFTNKLQPERCVNFCSTSDKYNIILDNKPAILMGSPASINGPKDIEILLDILENIWPKDPMIYYK